MLAYLSLALFSCTVNRKMGSCWYLGLIWKDVAVTIIQGTGPKYCAEPSKLGLFPFIIQAESAHFPYYSVSIRCCTGTVEVTLVIWRNSSLHPPAPFHRLVLKAIPVKELWALGKNGKFSEYGKCIYQKEVGWIKYSTWSDGTSEAEEKEGK